MKCLNFIIISFLLISRTCAQGGSDILYISRDSIGSKYINREVKIDLGKTKGNMWKEARTQDTIQIFLFGKYLTIVEHRKFGVDYWYFSDQLNECLNYENTNYAFVNRAILLKVEPTKFLFQVHLDVFDQLKNGQLLKSRSEDVWLDKKDISGIFVHVY